MAKFLLTSVAIAPALPGLLGPLWARPTEEHGMALKWGAWLTVKWGAEQAMSNGLYSLQWKKPVLYSPMLPSRSCCLGTVPWVWSGEALQQVRAGVVHHHGALAAPGPRGHKDSPVTSICSTVVPSVQKTTLDKFSKMFLVLIAGVGRWGCVVGGGAFGNLCLIFVVFFFYYFILFREFCGKDRKKGKVQFKKCFYFGKFFLLSQQKNP